MSGFDPEEIDLKVGLEIHQQLATKTKLFCSCSSFTDKEFEHAFIRRLRPTQSELGQIDPAALFEFKRGKAFRYHLGERSACLVEADEEPPHGLNAEAVQTVVMIALALNAQPVDELHVMRKIVIDGSNTTGFQRTLVVALGGALKAGGRVVPVQTICLEEDAARLLADEDEYREYALDRLCVPLVEVALAPITATPQEVQEVALALGRLLRATKRVVRGLGSIRQDVNVSIKGGGTVEVKGVQKLDLLGKVVEFEVLRQLSMLKIRDELQRRGLKPEDREWKLFDLSDVFTNTSCVVLKRLLREGGRVVGVKVDGFMGVLGFEPYPGVRLGRELADLVKFYGVGGIFHSDELPAYGISQKEVEEVKTRLEAKPDDAFVLLAGAEANLVEAREALIERIKQAFAGVPSETRGPTPDGKTRFTRPKPGPERMYPETDIPAMPIHKELVERLSQQVPPPWESQLEGYAKRYGLSKKLALQIYDSEYADLFEELASATSIQPSFIAAALTETVVNLSREGLDTSKLDEPVLREVFTSVDQGRVSKEAVPQMLKALLGGEAKNVDEATQRLGLTPMSDADLLQVIEHIVKENRAVVAEKGEQSFGLLMGRVMASVRGRADGQKVSLLLKERIRKEVQTGSHQSA